MAGIDSANCHVIYRGREHGEVTLPLATLLRDGKLDIFDEIKGKKYFQIYSRGAELVFQCGGYIGLIPVNEKISIEITPRVNITNLDRILRMAGAEHVLLPLLRRFYAATEEAVFLVDVIADALIETIDEIRDWGRHKEYTKRVYTGTLRSGRILINQTVRQRAKYPTGVVATTARFERDANNVLNACLQLALERLLASYVANAKDPLHQSSRVSRLNITWLAFFDIDVFRDIGFIVDEVERRINEGVVLSAPYKHALPLALAILKGLGPSQERGPPSFALGSLAFDMADTFERYIRSVLRDRLHFAVLDGNVAREIGAKERLFSESAHRIARNNFATPDIVIARGMGQQTIAVLDVKYKSYSGMPEREDINQVVTYAAVYGCDICGLIYLTRAASGETERFGKIGGVEVVGISIALEAVDLVAEEQRLAASVMSLIDAKMGVTPATSLDSGEA